MGPNAQPADNTLKRNIIEEAKVDLLKLAIKHNPPSVRVVARNLDGIMAAFLDAHNNNFGSITYCDRARTASSNALTVRMRLPTLTKAQRMDRAVWTNVVARHQIITQNPTHFFAEPVNRNRRGPGLPDKQHGPEILRNGRSPRDWSRAYWLLRASIYHCSRTRAFANTSTRFRNDPAEEPRYLTLSQERTLELAAHDLATKACKGASLLSGDHNDIESDGRFNTIHGADSPIGIPKSRDVGDQAYGSDRTGKNVRIFYPLISDQNMPTGETNNRMMTHFFLP